jgi:hypothetical protein
VKSLNLEIKLTAPTSWQALTEQQVVFIAHVLLQQPSKEDLLARCLLKFAGLHPVPITKDLIKRCTLLGKPVPSLYRYKNKILEIPDEQMAVFCRKLEYLAEPPGLMKCPSRLAGLYGPDPQLWTNTFEEYLMADRFYRAHSNLVNYPALQKETGLDFLCKMAAVLWRKKDTPYSDKELESNTRRIRRGTKPAELLAVYLWFTGVKLWLKEKYPDLFTPAGESGNEAGDDSESVMNMLYAITDGRAHENERVYKTPVHEVLHALNTKAKTINELNSKKP